MVRNAGSPPGFTLVEAVVALTILAIGLVGAAATQALAARLLREAEARAEAVAIAGRILDSLLAAPVVAGGTGDFGHHRATWSAVGRGTGTVVELEIEYTTEAGSRTLRFEMLHLPPLPRIGEDG